MDQALENWWQNKTRNALAEAEARGTVAVLKGLVDDGLISLAVAAERAGMTEQKFLETAEPFKAKVPAQVQYNRITAFPKTEVSSMFGGTSFLTFPGQGKFTVPDDMDGCNAEIAEMFGADTFSGMEIPGELSFSGDSERMGF